MREHDWKKPETKAERRKQASKILRFEREDLEGFYCLVLPPLIATTTTPPNIIMKFRVKMLDENTHLIVTV